MDLHIGLVWLSLALSHSFSEIPTSQSLVSGPEDGKSKPPLPGVSPLEKLNSTRFNMSYSNLWGPSSHQYISQDGFSVTLLLDRNSGSGFRSRRAYKSGFFNAAIKLQAGYTAGTITAFYLSNDEVYRGRHDEIDIELLGTIPGKPIVVQTNIYGNGTGDGIIKKGREEKFVLWFDPTISFHNYSLLWCPSQILFLVDGIPLRRIPRSKALGVEYPARPMSVYLTIWDASDWATDGGKYRANYTYEPFRSTYTNFILYGCRDRNCSDGFLESLIPSKPKQEFIRSLNFVRKNFMVYDYCQDLQRYPNRLPDCPTQNGSVGA